MVAVTAAATAEAAVTDKRSGGRLEALRPLLFLVPAAAAIGGGAAMAWGEGAWRAIVGPAGLGVALVLLPAAFHFAFTSSGFSAAYRSHWRDRRVFDPESRHHFDANHAEGFDLDGARHRGDGDFRP